MRTFSVCFIAVLLTSAQAQEARGPDAGYMRLSPVLMALDANRDGVISAKEIQDSPAALRTLVPSQKT